MSISSSRYSRYNSGWGTASFPHLSAEQLRVPELLDQVPKGGVVADIGAGVGLSLASFIVVERPDILTLSVDPGYQYQDFHQSLNAELNITVERFDNPCQRLFLKHNDRWLTMLAGTAEETPLKDKSVDLVLSYATVPEFTFGTEIAVREGLRILKDGQPAVYGPIQDSMAPWWAGLMETVAEEGASSAYATRREIVPLAYSGEAPASFTTIHK